MQKIVFIIPGYKQKPTQKSYLKVIEILKKEKYITVPISIPWEKRSITQNANFFVQEYKKILSFKKNILTKKIYILGFSFGAIIAFIASTKIKADGLILCSLSPFFNEDIKTKKYKHKEFISIYNSKLVKKIKTKQVHMLYGENEARPLIKRVNDTFNKINTPRKYLTAIKQTEHNLGNKRYLYQIYKTAQILK